VDGAFAILRLPHEEGPLTAQITLPFCLGGLGLSLTGPTKGSTAYLAAASSTHHDMRSGPQTFLPFEGPSSEQLST
jgi:hypothetical protein